MTELDFYKELVDWLGVNGKVNKNDLEMFFIQRQENKQMDEAKKFVDELFRGMS